MQVEPIECGLALSGELDTASAETLDVAFQQSLLESSGVFLLDLTGVSFMDSGGVNELLRLRSLLGREERALALICPDGEPKRVLDTIGVGELFTVFATRQAAAKALVPSD